MKVSIQSMFQDALLAHARCYLYRRCNYRQLGAQLFPKQHNNHSPERSGINTIPEIALNLTSTSTSFSSPPKPLHIRSKAKKLEMQL